MCDTTVYRALMEILNVTLKTLVGLATLAWLLATRVYVYQSEIRPPHLNWTFLLVHDPLFSLQGAQVVEDRGPS